MSCDCHPKMGCPHDYRITQLTAPLGMSHGVINNWGVVIAQFDTWNDAQLFRTMKAEGK